MPRQQRIEMPWEEYDELRRAGYGRDGPSMGSSASNVQKGIGNVQKGSEFAALQRRGMLAEVDESDSDDDLGQSSELGGVAGGVGVALGIAAGIGALLYGGYRAYKYFTKDKPRASSPTFMPSSFENRRETSPYRPVTYDTFTNSENNINDNQQRNAASSVDEDFLNTIARSNENRNMHTLRLRQKDLPCTGALTRTNVNDGRAIRNVNEDSFNTTLENNENRKMPTLRLRQEDSQLTDGCTKANDNEAKVEELAKGEAFNGCDKYGKEDSEKLQQVNQPPTDAPHEEAQANLSDEEVEDFNGEYAGKPDPVTKILKRG